MNKFLISLMRFLFITGIIIFILFNFNIFGCRSLKSIENYFKTYPYAYNTNIRDFQAKCLSFDKMDNEIQGCIDVKNQYNVLNEFPKLLLSSLLINNRPKRVLILGLGVGIIVRVLNKLLPDTEVDIVEISKEIINIAKKDFNLVINNKSKIYNDDALKFIKKRSRDPNFKDKYDIILIDIYSPDGMITMFDKLNNAKSIKSILNVDGVLAYNVVDIYNSDTELMYRKLFERVLILKGLDSGNNILLMSKNVELKYDYWRDKFKDVGVDVDWLKNRIY